MIWSYIANDSATAADDFIGRIDTRLHVLAEHPLIGSDRSEIRPGLRSISEGNYLLFYRPMRDGVRIIRILHASRDVSKVFRVR